MPEGAAALAKQVRAIVGQRLDIFVCVQCRRLEGAAIEEHTIEDFDNLFAAARDPDPSLNAGQANC